MTRLWHSGFETGHDHAEAFAFTTFGSTWTYDTAVKRTGTRSRKLVTSASAENTYAFISGGVGVAGRDYFLSGYIYIPAASGYPSAATPVIQLYTGASQAGSVSLDTSGRLYISDRLAAARGSAVSAALATDTWHRVEFRCRILAGASDDQLELRVNGTTVESLTGLTVATAGPGTLYIGMSADPGTSEVIHFDDFAINDNQGSVNNTWVGEHECRLLLPTADSSIGNWVLGSGSASNIFEGVNNVPPVGVAGGGSASEQIKNTSTSVPSNYDATTQTYTAAGVTGTIAALFPVAEIGPGGAGGTSDFIGVGVVSNPAVANVSTAPTGTNSGYPTGWMRAPGTMTENPSVTLGTAPVMRVTKTVATTRANTVCLMGIYVDSVPGAAATPRRRSIMMIG